MSGTDFEHIAEVLVGQHYASGPAEMKKVVARALAEAATGKTRNPKSPREQLESEVAEAVKASALGSE